MEKNFFYTHVCLCLFRKKTHHRLCDVNDDAYFKDEEEDEDKEEEDTSKSASSLFR